MITKTQRKAIEDRLAPGTLVWRLSMRGTLALRQVKQIGAREWVFEPPGGGPAGYMARPKLTELAVSADGFVAGEEGRAVRFWWHTPGDVFEGSVPDRIFRAAPHARREG